MKIKSFKILSLLFSISLIGCSSPKSEIKVDEKSQTDELVAVQDSSSQVDDIFYQVPTPNELFAVLKNSNTPYNKDILNDISNLKNYTSKGVKGLNFGVYAADLAYVSSLGHIEDASKIFETIRTLSKDLEIENALDEVIYKRIQSNLESSNADSLFYLSNDVYYSAYSYLDQNDRGDVLGMIVVGGWIEGLNIILNLEPYSEGSEIVQRIADQKLTLENLLIFTSKINDEDLNTVISELGAIDEVFNSVSSNDEAENELTTTTSEDGVVMFGGGASLMLSEEQFNKLKNIVQELRSSIIEGAL
tara:strand:+ start:26649 stop:27560 length:912 start_codon:yes stop_codon:yes gene_type:complete